MYVLIETIGYKAIVSFFDNEKEVEAEMKQRYNKAVKGADRIDWKRTYFMEDKRYARVYDWRKEIEYRVAVTDGG